MGSSGVQLMTKHDASRRRRRRRRRETEFVIDCWTARLRKLLRAPFRGQRRRSLEAARIEEHVHSAIFGGGGDEVGMAVPVEIAAHQAGGDPAGRIRKRR